MSIQTLTPLQEKIMNFLVAGIAPARIASVMECSPGYVSELLSQEWFANLLAEKKVAGLEEVTSRDRKLDKIEDQVIMQVARLVESPLAFNDPMQAIRALSMVNGLKRRGSSVDSGSSVINQTVVLNIPSVTRDKFIVDISNKVVKIGDKDMVTIGSSKMEELANEHTKQHKHPITIDDIK